MKPRMNFLIWMTQFKEEISDRGELSRFMLFDLHFPIDAKSPSDGYEYLETNADKKLQNAWINAWSEYRKIPNPATPEILKVTNRSAYYKKCKKIAELGIQ